MVNLLVVMAVLVAIVIGEMVFRRYPNSGGLLYNLMGVFGGLFWVLVGAFLALGGYLILGFVVMIIGFVIHRSNYKQSREAVSGRKYLNG